MTTVYIVNEQYNYRKVIRVESTEEVVINHLNQLPVEKEVTERIEVPPIPPGDDPDNPDYFFVPSKGVRQRINKKSIFYLEADRSYCRIYFVKKNHIMICTPMGKFFPKLLSPKFMQVHRSYAVNIDYVEKVDMKNNKIILSNGAKVKLGRKYRKKVRDAFQSIITESKKNTP